MKLSQSTKTCLDATLAATVLIALLGITTYLLYAKSVSALEEQIKAGLISTVSASATTLNGDIHRHFNAETLPDDPEYHAMAMQMERIRQAATDVRYIYTCILKPQGIYFIVNPSPQNDGDGDGLPDPPPALMTLYDDAPQELMDALKNQEIGVSAVPYRDQWGTFISAYAPFYDAKGEFVGVLAMDLELSGFYKRLSNIQRVFGKAKIIILFLGLIAGLVVWWIRRSHVNNVRELKAAETQAAYRVSQFRHSRDALLEVVRYFSHQLSEQLSHGKKDRSLSDCPQKILRQAESYHQAVYDYALSQGDISTVIESFYLSDWFGKLNSVLQQAGSGQHEWLGEMPHPVQGDCQALLEAFSELYYWLSQILNQPVSGQTSIAEEGLDRWHLVTEISVHGDVGQTRCRHLLQLSAEDGAVNRLVTFSSTDLHLLKVIHILQQLACELTLNDYGVLHIAWQVGKEKGE
ncbi:cache domain-containing protein [Vibrio mangrovi]|uniref:Cache domain-containing protein n=1 Tax=Vibrio mangrovi TaxID=474394 RepID=A0A1Y6ITD5_9VIBR|nr:cache domain-containing protein [Vibrio mangrovi]MDW6004649.1 cache domain-containing protein [Vibrio mangrovi]SMS00939.1 hypothetical protein VIM7927_02214 [Vibrio mangrovi]